MARRLLILPLIAAVLGLGACGASTKLLPPGRAAQIDQALADLSDATSAGDCAKAGAALERAQKADASLPATVDAGLRSSLRDGLSQLSKTVSVQCQAAGAAAQTPTGSSQTTGTTAPTTGTTTTETATATTPTTTEPPPTTTTTPPTTTPTTTPTDTNPGGVSPTTPPPAAAAPTPGAAG